MATLTKLDAARQLGISRTTLYKLIDQGRLSATPDGLIDETELVRVAPYVDTLREHTRTRMHTVDGTKMDTPRTGGEHDHRVHEQGHAHVRTPVPEHAWTAMDTLVDILREQLQAAQERERDYREHIAQLTTMLDQAHQQNQRLLAMPRPPAAARPQEALGAPQPPKRVPSPPMPHTPPGAHREAMRWRIVALLQEHPEGLTPGEIQTLLGVNRNLADTVLGMVRYGLVQRVGRGRYIAAPP